MKYFIVILILGFALGMISCGGPDKTIPTAEEAGWDAIYVPPWYNSDSCQVTVDYLCQLATMESKGQQVAVNKATVQARSELQAQLEAKLELLVKSFAREVGLGIESEYIAQYTQTIKEISSGVLRGSVPWKQEARVNKEGLYRGWVSVRLLLNEAYLANLKALKTNSHLYTRFQESEAFKKHEEEIEKFEQYKKEQGY